MAQDPNVKDLHDDSPMSDRMKKFVTELRTSIQSDDDNRTSWKRKLVVANNQRLGVKRITDKPYPGAPNIPLPETDKNIAKQKPNYVLSIFTAKKKCFVEPADGVPVTPEVRLKAKKAELGMNYLLNNKIKLLDVLELAADYALEKGHVVGKVIEKFDSKMVHRTIDLNRLKEADIKALKKLKSEQITQLVSNRFGLDPEDDEDKEIIDDIISQFRSGKKVIEFDMEVVESFPDIIIPAPEDVIPASFGTNDLDDSERITHQLYRTKRQLIEGSLRGEYDKRIAKLIESGEIQGTSSRASTDSGNELIEQNKNINEGVTSDDSNKDIFRLLEVTTWYQPSDKKPYERWVFTYLADGSDPEHALIKKHKHPFEFLNYAKYDNEAKDIRWHASRGIPEKVRALQEFMEKSFNNAVIRDEINNNPMYTVLSTSNIQGNAIRFIPGQKLKVKSHGEIQKLEQNTLVDIQSERLVQLMKAFTEEYLGSTDQLFKNATNQGGGKTLGEVELGVQLATGQLTLNVLRWFQWLQKLYVMLFKAMKDRLGESIFVGNIEITADDFNFEARVIPNGSLDLANRQIRLQKALTRIQLIAGGPPEIITPQDKYNAYEDYLEADDVLDPTRFISTPEEVAQIQQQMMAQEDQVLAQQQAGLDQEIAGVQQQANQGAEGGESGTSSAS